MGYGRVKVALNETNASATGLQQPHNGTNGWRLSEGECVGMTKKQKTYIPCQKGCHNYTSSQIDAPI